MTSESAGVCVWDFPSAGRKDGRLPVRLRKRREPGNDRQQPIQSARCDKERQDARQRAARAVTKRFFFEMWAIGHRLPAKRISLARPAP